MTVDALRATLVALAGVMPAAQERWWVVGSAAVFLHGGDTNAADVDVLLTEMDARRVSFALGIEPSVGEADNRFHSAVLTRWTAPLLP